MTLLFRAAVLLLAVLQAVQLVRVARHDHAHVQAVRAYEAGRFVEALDLFERARGYWGSPANTWAWAGDAALQACDAPPEGAWPDATVEALLRRGWQGYAGAVVRSPVESWSWSGLAEMATREARRLDARAGVSLAELDARRRGALDPRRAVALAAARLAVRLKPSGFQELDVLAGLYESAGDVARAQGVFVESARMMPAPAFHVWGRRERMEPTLYRAILQGLEQGVSRAPSFERSLLHREIGLYAWKQGDLPAAVRHLGTAETTATSPMERHLAVSDLARALDEVGRGEEAVAAHRRALVLGFAPGSDAQLLGSLELRLGRYAQACADLRTALRHDPARPGLHEHAASACELAGEPELAEALLRDGFVDAGQDPQRALAILDLYWRTGRRRAGMEMASQWLREDPGRQDVARWIGHHDALLASERARP